EEQRIQAELEAARQREAEARRQREEEKERRRKAKEEEEQRRKEAAEAAARQRQEEEERQRAAEEAARQQAEAQRKRQEEEARLVAEAERLRAEAEARRKAEEKERLRLEAEEQRKREEEEKRQRAAAAAEQAKRREEEEARQRAEAERQAEEQRRREAAAAALLARAEEERRREREASIKQEEARRLAAAEPAAGDASTAIVNEPLEESDGLAGVSAPAASDRVLPGGTYENLTRETQAHTETTQHTHTDDIPAGTPAPDDSPLFTPLAKPDTSSALRLGIAAVVVLFIAVTGASLLLWSKMPSSSNQDGGNPTPGPSPTSTPTSARDILIPGGTFLMGRNDVDPASEEHGNEFPAHAVPVDPFYMDLTEVTNAEYAEFVRETNHRVPKDDELAQLGKTEEKDWKPWIDRQPPAGQEQWPVRNVSVEDAKAFAAWRSKRDSEEYRLPTEEEWEFAARSGNATYLYPWGPEWSVERANIETGLPKPVGSYPKGINAWGILDLIGNASEWTSSANTIYKDNKKLQVNLEKRNRLIRRGGNYQDKLNDNVTAAFRTGFAPTKRYATTGFRLVRDAQ
ncbi:MAG: formylglycine-generating enzyme family protein, partial [Pyrinomonadaceae bacterium]